MKHKVFSVDIERCIACRSCEAACAREHGGTSHMFVTPGHDQHAVPLCCLQCAKSPCVETCPTAALERTAHGAVMVHHSRCIGCCMCIIACPFGVIVMDEDKGIQKCDRCIHRLQRGKDPACVLTCPTGALIYDAGHTMMIKRRRTYALKEKKR